VYGAWRTGVLYLTAERRKPISDEFREWGGKQQAKKNLSGGFFKFSNMAGPQL